MRKSIIILLMSFYCVYLPSFATAKAAGFITGNDLRTLCSSNEIILQNACKSYIVGVVDGFVSGMVVIQSNRYCLGSNVTQGVVVSAVSEYLEENPQELPGPASNSIFWSLTSAFPCS